MAGYSERTRETALETAPEVTPAQVAELPQLSLWLLAGWVALVVAGGLLGVAAHSTRLLPGDLYLAHAVQAHHAVDPVLAPLLTAASFPGNAPWDAVLYAVAVAVPVLLRRWAVALLLALTATGDALGGTVKLVVARARPTADLVTIVRHATGYSFPSGHVVHYVVFFGALAYVCHRCLAGTAAYTGPRRMPDAVVRWTLLALRTVCLALIALVGVSRVFLGAHWPSDVAGGYLIGGAWLALMFASYRRWIHPRWAQPRSGGAAAGAGHIRRSATLTPR